MSIPDTEFVASFSDVAAAAVTGVAADVIESVIEAQDIPGQVASGVTADIAGRDMILGSDPRVMVSRLSDLGTVWGVVDSSSHVAIGVDSTGKTFLRLSASAQASDGSLVSDHLLAAGLAPLLAFSGSDTYLTGAIDANNRIAENAIMLDGTIPAWVLDRVGTYLGVKNSYAVTKTVKTDGTGDFTTLLAACNSITDSSPRKRYLVVVYPGLYEDTTSLGATGSIVVPAYTTVRGTNKDLCIVSRSLPDSASNTDIAQADTFLLVNRSSRVENLTVWIANGRYCIHSDLAGVNTGTTLQVVNVNAVHKGITSSNGLGGSAVAQQAWGYGAASGQNVLVDRARMQSLLVTAFMHNRQDFSDPSEVAFRRSRFSVTTTTQAPQILVQSLGSGQTDRMLCEECEFPPYTAIIGTDSPWISVASDRQYADKYEIDPVFSHSGPLGYLSSFRGKALKVQSATTGATSTVRFSGTAAAALIGAPTLRDGSVGFSGYSYGYWDISGITVDVNNSTTVNNTIGRRLGDCSTTALTLTITIDGTAHNVVFNTNLTAVSNATILASINTALGSAGTATEYLLADVEHYPTIIGCQESLVNVDTTGIPQWSALAYSGAGVRLFAPGDPVTIFAGVAVERIAVGKVGRFITNGTFNAAQLAGAPTMTTAGTVIYFSDTTAGQFATTGTRAAGTALFGNGGSIPAWLPLKGIK